MSNDDRLREIISKDGQVEVTIPYTDNKTLDNLTRKVSISSVKNKVVYISLSPLTVEWFILQKFSYLITEKAYSKGIFTAPNVSKAMEWNSYPAYSQYDSIMQSFINLYPALCHLDTIGTSINGKLVLALKISDNSASDDDEPEVFYTSTMHGDETGGFVLMLRFADYLLKNYNLDSRVTNLIDNLEIWINPLANPDGTYGNGDSISSPTRFNANGVDLNRNFPDPLDLSIVPQKETLDMIKFMRKHKFVISANFHSGNEVVNYPWDRWYIWEKLHADNDWFYNISRKYADTVHFYSISGYMTFKDNGVTNGSDWYKIVGGRQDFVTYELQGREVTIELDDQFITPATQLTSLWQYNWHSLLGYLENALCGIHGIVRDAGNASPVSAKIFNKSHDKDNSHVFSDTLTGSFVRFLAPGTWDLSFSANGYYDTLLSNIMVVESQKTDILVEMRSNINPVDTSQTSVTVIYPNPANSFIKAVLPEKIVGTVNVMIISQSGKLLSDYKTEAVHGTPLIIDIRGFSAGTYSVVFTNTVTKISSGGRFIVIK